MLKHMTTAPFIRRLAKNVPHLFRREPCYLLTEILLTYHCTQRCLQCCIPQKAADTKRMGIEDFKTVVARLDEYGAHGIILSGGEPLLYPQLIDCIEYVARKRFTYLHLLSTLFASGTKVERLVKALLTHRMSITCSFDGFGPLADELRGGKNVSTIVMENMEFLDRENRKRGRPIKTGVNIVISQINLHQIPEILSYIERIGWLASLDVYRYTSDNQIEDDRMKIEDLDELRRVIELAKRSPAVVTPTWLLDGHVRYRENNLPKLCPYLLSPSLGSRFFVHPNGDVKVCLGSKVGNLLAQTPREILDSSEWRTRQEEFVDCRGCWTTCHTPFAKLSNYDWEESTRAYRVLRNYKNFPSNGAEVP